MIYVLIIIFHLCLFPTSFPEKIVLKVFLSQVLPSHESVYLKSVFKVWICGGLLAVCGLWVAKAEERNEWDLLNSGFHLSVGVSQSSHFYL